VTTLVGAFDDLCPSFQTFVAAEVIVSRFHAYRHDHAVFSLKSGGYLENTLCSSITKQRVLHPVLWKRTVSGFLPRCSVEVSHIRDLLSISIILFSFYCPWRLVLFSFSHLLPNLKPYSPRYEAVLRFSPPFADGTSLLDLSVPVDLLFSFSAISLLGVYALSNLLRSFLAGWSFSSPAFFLILHDSALDLAY